MRSSETVGKLAEALAKAQGQIKPAERDASNPFYKSSYATLGSVLDACRAPLQAHGLAVIQGPGTTQSWAVALFTRLLHTSGEWIESEYPVNPVKNDPQGMGSAISYARRYALAAMVGVVQADDDGEQAMQRPTPQAQTRPQPQPRPAQVVAQRPGLNPLMG